MKFKSSFHVLECRPHPDTPNKSIGYMTRKLRANCTSMRQGRACGTRAATNWNSCRRQFNSSAALLQSPLQKTIPELRTYPDQTYNTLLHLCLDQCRAVQTRHSFDDMPHRVSRALGLGKSIHALSLQFGFWSKGSLGNAIIDLYAKCGDADVAEKAFNRLHVRDILAWNSLFSMKLKQGFSEQVLKSFCLLKNSYALPNEFTLAIVLSASARLGRVEFGRQVHSDVIKMGLERIRFCEGALIDMYAKCDSVRDARLVLDGALNPDTVSWTAMVSGYIQSGMLEEALKVCRMMQQAGRVPDSVAIITIINAFVYLGRLDEACALFAQLCNPDVVAWNVMISGHSRRGYAEKAIKFYQNMRNSGVKPTRSTFGSVLSAVSNLAALDFGLLVHAEAIKQGLETNVYVGSSLISLYAKCGKINSAKYVFDGINERNVVLWNAMLGGFVQNGYAADVISLFYEMKSSGFHPDDFTYTSILSACASLESAKIGQQLHGALIKTRLASNLFVGNALVDMYAKSGALTEARRQFELMENHDNISWNSIIVGYVIEGNEVEAFKMFRNMNLHGISPDEVSLASVFSACANTQDLKQGQQVHCLSVKHDLQKSLYAGSALTDMYSKCGDTLAARIVFCAMPERTVVSANAMISGYVHENLREAVNIFSDMQVENLKPSEVTFVILLDACDGSRLWNLGRQLHCLIRKWGLLNDEEFLGVALLGMYMNSQRYEEGIALFSEFCSRTSPVLWTSIISGLAQNDCSEEALMYFKEMRCCNASPDQATFVSTLRASSVLSSLREGRQIHAIIFQTGYDQDEITSSSVVDMYAKCGDIVSAAQTFEEMIYRNKVISWNSIIVGFAKNGHAEDALRVFDEMKKTSVIPDSVTFLGVLTACSHAGRVSEGRQVFYMMVNYYGIQARADHCACMVDLLGRWGFLKEAVEFINSLKFKPDSKIWATLLGACTIHGDESRGKWAADKQIELEPENSSPYVLLSNIHAASGNWSEVNALRREMRKKGVKKLPGCSWIVVGQKVNLFVAGDKFHPEANEIDAALKDLIRHMKRHEYISEPVASLLEEE